MADGAFRSIDVRDDGEVCTIAMTRGGSGNAINRTLVDEMRAALAETRARIVVLEGTPEIFCQGADFADIDRRGGAMDAAGADDPGPMYALWRQLATGPFVSVAHVRGKVAAGGVGFVAACNIVLSDETATFGLSEMLFGLMPACVLPFLVQRIGFARANYLTLNTQPIGARQALDWGLVDAVEERSDALLRKHLLRLKRLGRPAVQRYKAYAATLTPLIDAARPAALAANIEVFADPANRANISRYVNEGRFPWETD
jgi:polyketide biosynthesis enoyl-CoA hydratase PksH